MINVIKNGHKQMEHKNMLLCDTKWITMHVTDL
jgi:hypothetical protein